MGDKPVVKRKIAVRKDKGSNKPIVVQKAKADKPKAPVVQKPKADKATPKDEPQDDDGETISALNQHVLDQDYSWETDSMLADMLDGLPKDEIIESMSSSFPLRLNYCGLGNVQCPQTIRSARYDF